MSDIKNSKLLDKVLKTAREIMDPDSALTLESFVAAAIFCLQFAQKDLEDYQIEERTASEDIIKANYKEPIRAVGSLMEYIKVNSSGDYKAVNDMKTALNAANTEAIKKGRAEVRLDDVLNYISEHPSPTIKDVMLDEPIKDMTKHIENKRESKSDGVNNIRKVANSEGGNITKGNDLTVLIRKIKYIQRNLCKEIYGQDHAINVFASGYFNSEVTALSDKAHVRPRAIYLFAGPPGTGKTLLAEQAAHELGLPFRRFDMSEYSDREANLEFAGSDKVYKNGAPGNVTDFVDKNPKSVLLFDEIEKAHMVVIHLFLQILDAGKLRDNFTDKEVSFKDTIIIITTNAGKQLYENSESDDLSHLSRKVILKALEEDINPGTGQPYFPAAICSRFASSNVVMFNHVDAYNLRLIAKRELLKQAENFEKAYGIHIEIEENVFTALLLSEGGGADARTVRSRASMFLQNECYELFRLLDAGSEEKNITSPDVIRITALLPEEPDVRSLFEANGNINILIFADEKTAEKCRGAINEGTVLSITDVEDAKRILRDNDIDIVLVDPGCGKKEDDQHYLNLEDVDSKARDFMVFMGEFYPETPLYIIEKEDRRLNDNEKTSYRSSGVRDFISINDDPGDLANKIREILMINHQQESIRRLGSSNKLVSFETAQRKSDVTTAEIILFDFKLKTAVEAEDAQNILSNISRPVIRFDQVIGAEDAKDELKYYITYLKNPKKFKDTGVKAPKGVILYGPPGTGKTMLAKAMAGESEVTFISTEGNQFLQDSLGDALQKVHEVFRTARKYSPSILFIDEIDAIAKERIGSSPGMDAILTAFLTEMDKFKDDPSRPVFVLGATNFNVKPGSAKSLDPALMRRFDRKILVDLPSKEERIRFMHMKMSENHAFAMSDAMIDNIADRSVGMSLADLELVMEMALRATIRASSTIVTDEIFEESFETNAYGESKGWKLEEIRRVAIHESGHALICWLGGETPSYLTVVARGNHGGYMQHANSEGKGIYTKDDILKLIRTSLGARAAEVVCYGEEDGLSSGAADDLRQATEYAKRMVCNYGMVPEIGMASLDPESLNDEMAEKVQKAINKILQEQFEEAVRLVTENRKALDELVNVLLEKDHMTGAEIDTVIKKYC